MNAKFSRQGGTALPAVLASVALLTVIAACSGGSAATSDSADAGATAIGTENIAVVTLGLLQSGPTVSGTLVAEREATVRAQVGGSVLQTLAERGQAVRPGQVLARIETGGLQDAFLSARAGVTSATSSADLARRELARAEKLLAAGAIAERDIEQARRQAIAAEAALADARARLSAARKQVGNTIVASPIAGVVSERPVSAGDVVQAGSPLFTIVDPSSMRLEASVPANYLADVKLGTTTNFTVSGYPGREFTGRVTRIIPVADPATRQVRIYVSIPNASGALVGGLFATGRLASSESTGLLVPLSAIDTRSSVPAVLRLKQGKAERVQVELGLRDDRTEQVEVRAGVQAGDTLLVGAAQGITPGTAVRVSTPSDRAQAAPGS